MQTHCDVVVVGGGVIGLACSHYLADTGRQVRILEQDQIGSGASHANCGLIYTSDLIPLCAPGAVRQELWRMLRRRSPLHIQPSLNWELMNWLARFALKCNRRHLAHAMRAKEGLLRHSRRLYDVLFGDGLLSAEYDRKGVLIVFRDKNELKHYARTIELLKPFGFDAELMEGQALFDHEPALRRDVCGVWYQKGDSHLRPEALMESWKNYLVGRGVDMVERCELHRFVSENGRIVNANTSLGDFSADNYVLAAGAWTPMLVRPLDLRLPIVPGKGYSITMSRPANCPRIPCYLHERNVVVTPWASGYRLGGTMEFSGFNTEMRSKRLEHLRTAAGEYLKDPLGASVREEWVGLRPMTYDDLPVIGPAPGHRNLYLASGHGMLGISMAPSTGLLISELIAGNSPHIDPSFFDPHRFHFA
jgi:D-amino-acid dehydrogenase